MSLKEEKLFNEVFLQFHALLFSFGKKIVGDEYIVEECIQELFLYIYQKEIKLSEITNIKAYLLTAFRRRILLKKKTMVKLEDLSAIPTDMHFTTEDFHRDEALHAERKTKLAEMLNELPWRQREAVYLKFFNGLSGKEIAEIMGIQTQVVANMVYKALKKMRSSTMVLIYWTAGCWIIF